MSILTPRLDRQRLALTNARVLLPDGHLEYADVIISDETIIDVTRPGAVPFAIDDDVREFDGATIAPGFVDTHIHGGLGRNAMEGSVEALSIIARRLAAAGVTSFVATTASTDYSRILDSVAKLADVTRQGLGRALPELLGIHLEGPFLSPDNPGVHGLEYLVPPTPARIKQLLTAANGHLRVCTLAPELPGALEAITLLSEHAVRVSIGHTAATLEQTRAGIEAGAMRATHLFNAMPPIHHRAPGPIPVLLSDRGIMVELVADGHHVAPSLMSILFAASSIAPRIMLVSDGTDVSGLPDGEYHRWEGVPVTMTHGQARNKRGAIAGSTSTIVDGVRVLVSAGVDLEAALYAASTAPAQSLGLADRGIIATGKRADLVILDGQLQVSATVIRGQLDTSAGLKG